MRIVFLNLADEDDHGLAKTSVKALQIKYAPVSWPKSMLVGQNSVELYPLFDLFLASKAGQLFAQEGLRQKLEAIRVACRSADKIMLAAHGNYGDTVEIAADPGWEQGAQRKIGTYKELAALMRELLAPDCRYRLSLIICYAARSQDVRKDHDGKLSAIDIRSSFAFKFYSEICTHARIQMTARIGAVSFDEKTGKSMVRTEAATASQIDHDELQRSEEVVRAALEYEVIKERHTGALGPDEQFQDMQEKFCSGTGKFIASANAVNAEERIVQNYYRLSGAATDLELSASKNEFKYGKLIYRFLFNKVAVFTKYPKEELLYVGQL